MHIHYPLWSERVSTHWFYSWLIWGSHDKLAQLSITFWLIHSLLYLAGKQISHLSLCCNYFSIKSKMSGQRERNITSFFVKRRKIAGKSVYFFGRLKARSISFELCCRNYIFQIYVIRKKKRWVSVHKTTNAQTLEISRLIWMKT